MSYQMTVDAQVKNLGDLVELGKQTEAQSARAQKMAEYQRAANDAVAASVNPFNRARAAAEEYGKQQEKIARDRERYHEDQKRQIKEEEDLRKKATASHDQSNQQLAASVKNWITNPLAAAGEAASNFALQYGAVGIAAVGVGTAAAAAAVYLRGATHELGAYAEAIQNTAIRTGLTTTETQLFSRSAEVAGVNAGSLTTAMRTLSKGLSENSDEGKKQKKALDELGLGAKASLLPMGELLPIIFEKLGAVGNAMERDRIAITLFGRGGLELLPLAGHLDELKKKIEETGVVIDEQGIKKLAAFDDKMDLVGMRWTALKNKLAEKSIATVEIVTTGAVGLAEGVATYLGAYGTAYSAVGNALFGGSATPGDREMEETGGWGYSASMSRRGHGADVRHMERNEALRKSALREKSGDNGLGEARADLAEAMDRLKRADPSGDISKELGAVQSAKNRVSAIQDETKATKELASAKEKVVEIEKKASESLSKAASRGGFASKLESDIGVVRAETIDEIRKSGKSPELVRRIQQAGAVREYGVILAAKSAAEKRGYRLEDESFSPDYRAEHGPSMYDPDGHLRAGIFGGFTRPTAPSGYISPDEQLREARDQERRGMSQIGVRGALAGDSARGTVEATYQARLRYAAIEEAAQIRIANLKGDAAAKETALAMAAEKRYDASIERETALMHLALQQKQEFQSLAVGLFEAARGGGAGVSRFLGGQVSHLGDTVVGNAAGMAWPAIKSAMGGLHATDDPNSFMGRLLKGTPFGADPLAAATTANTAATVANTAALTGMGTAGMFGGSGVAGGAASGTNANGDSGPINQPFSTSIRNQAIGYGIGFAAAGFGAYNGFSRGGAQGALQGTGSLLGAAAMIPGPQQPYIMAAAAVTGLVAAVLGDPKQRRSNDIGNALKYNQFVAPVALNASMSTGGTYADYDRFGNVRGSSLSPFPSVDQPYFDYRNGVTVPGRTDSQFGPPIVVNINAIDGPSVQRVLMSNPDAVAAGVVAAANRGGNAMMTTLRSQM